MCTDPILLLLFELLFVASPFSLSLVLDCKGVIGLNWPFHLLLLRDLGCISRELVQRCLILFFSLLKKHFFFTTPFFFRNSIKTSRRHALTTLARMPWKVVDSSPRWKTLVPCRDSEQLCAKFRTSARAYEYLFEDCRKLTALVWAQRLHQTLHVWSIEHLRFVAAGLAMRIAEDKGLQLIAGWRDIDLLQDMHTDATLLAALSKCAKLVDDLYVTYNKPATAAWNFVQCLEPLCMARARWNADGKLCVDCPDLTPAQVGELLHIWNTHSTMHPVRAEHINWRYGLSTAMSAVVRAVEKVIQESIDDEASDGDTDDAAGDAP
jgi:hypothetical protein